MRAAGFVLVGGESSRMGRDKARLPIAFHTLAEDVAAKLARVVDTVALVGKPERYADLGFECLADLRSHRGPLAGIESALASGRGELNLITACDMPGLQVSWLEALMHAARTRDAACYLARDSAGSVHPLCSVWRSACLPAVREALARGNLKVFDLINTLETHLIDVPDRMHNLNTPAEWNAWQNCEELRS